ncbi:hypothetical protein [Methanobacterium sp.]|uniref:hypothetical protein n=1 Tax=Methanobacterium sp. TaxID=2164 RepID=UPI003C71F84C
MPKEIIKDSFMPFSFMALTVLSFYFKSSAAGIGIAFLGSCTVPVIYKALNYYNKPLYILISAAASIGGLIIFCLYSNSINLLTIFAGGVFSFIAFYEAYKTSKYEIFGVS